MSKWFMGFILVYVALLTNIVAGDNPRAVIVFDASGSMWGQIHGKTKIEIARDAMKNVVKAWNPEVELGLIVYGHRKKGDCNDIENIVPVGKVDKQKIIHTVMGIQPKGKTPISRSLRKAADDLRYTEEKATIILISDGKETCDPDPCGTAKQLKKEGIDFVTHVIGFDVDRKTDEQLACIAHATGGEYFSAKNAKELNKAIKVVAKKVEKPKPVVPKETFLIPHVRYDMLPKGLDITGVKLTVTQDGKEIYSGDEVAPKIKAKAGNVQIEVDFGAQNKALYLSATLESQKENHIIILVKSGKVTIDTAEEAGGPKVKSDVHIYPVVEGEPDMADEASWCVPTKRKPCERVLPVGEYLVTAAYNSMKTQKRFTVEHKKEKTLHLFFRQTGKVAVTASEKEGGKWVDASCRIYRVIDGEVDTSDSWHVGPGKKEAGERQIPVGDYVVKCSYKNGKKSVPFTIKGSKTTKVHVVFKPFFIGAKCTNSSDKVSYEIYSSSGQLIYEKRAPCSQAFKVILDDGKYTVEASVKEGKGEAQFSVGTGKPAKLILDLTNLNHEEEIKADTPEEAVVVPVKPKSKKEPKAMTIGGKKIVVEGMDEAQIEEMKKAAQMIEALGAMFGGAQPKSASRTAQENPQEDKAFEEMSKELEMYTK